VQEQHEIARKNQLIDALRELKMQEEGAGGEDMKFISEEYREIIRDADLIRAQFKMQPRKLNYLWGVIADLYTDTAKIKGRHNVQSKMGILKQILQKYNYDMLFTFFAQSWE